MKKNKLAIIMLIATIIILLLSLLIYRSIQRSTPNTASVIEAINNEPKKDLDENKLTEKINSLENKINTLEVKYEGLENTVNNLEKNKTSNFERLIESNIDYVKKNLRNTFFDNKEYPEKITAYNENLLRNFTCSNLYVNNTNTSSNYIFRKIDENNKRIDVKLNDSEALLFLERKNNIKEINEEGVEVINNITGIQICEDEDINKFYIYNVLNIKNNKNTYFIDNADQYRLDNPLITIDKNLPILNTSQNILMWDKNNEIYLEITGGNFGSRNSKIYRLSLNPANSFYKEEFSCEEKTSNIVCNF